MASAPAVAFLAENGAEPVEDRLARGAKREGAVSGGRGAGVIGHDAFDRDRRVQDEDEEAERDEREHAVT